MRALVVADDDMCPWICSGAVLWVAIAPCDPAEQVDKISMCAMEDGRKLLREIKAGDDLGLFTLVATNAPTIHNTRVVACYPIGAIWYGYPTVKREAGR